MQQIYNFTLKEIEEVLKENQIPSFRAKQIWNFLYVNHVESFDEMQTISKKDQEKLKQIFKIKICEEKLLQISKDKTQKVLLTLEDNESVETVLMKYKHGYSVCVSSQIGCKVGCSFCASHILGFKRNLTTAEIVSQIMYWDRKLKKKGSRVSNVVIMGIGEPFYNLDNVLKFIDIVNDEKGLNIGSRRFTISTSGIVSKFDEFLKYGKQINLAISLHAPTNEKRSKIMQINNAYNIEDLMLKVDEYLDKTNRQVTFEYLLLKGTNDTEEDAEKLSKLIGKRNIHVNLIDYNSVDEYGYEKSLEHDANKFEEILVNNRISVTKRQSKGDDIDGACGQLRSKDNFESND